MVETVISLREETSTLAQGYDVCDPDPDYELKR
jgi:hypothetical protein